MKRKLLVVCRRLSRTRKGKLSCQNRGRTVLGVLTCGEQQSLWSRELSPLVPAVIVEVTRDHEPQ